MLNKSIIALSLLSLLTGCSLDGDDGQDGAQGVQGTAGNNESDGDRSGRSWRCEVDRNRRDAERAEPGRQRAGVHWDQRRR